MCHHQVYPLDAEHPDKLLLIYLRFEREDHKSHYDLLCLRLTHQLCLHCIIYLKVFHNGVISSRFPSAIIVRIDEICSGMRNGSDNDVDIDIDSGTCSKDIDGDNGNWKSDGENSDSDVMRIIVKKELIPLMIMIMLMVVRMMVITKIMTS